MKFGDCKYIEDHQRRADLCLVSTKYSDVPLVYFLNCRFGERRFSGIASLPEPKLQVTRRVTPPTVSVSWERYTRFVLQNRGLTGYLLHRLPQKVTTFVPTAEEKNFGNCIADTTVIKTADLVYDDTGISLGNDYTYRMCSIERTS